MIPSEPSRVDGVHVTMYVLHMSNTHKTIVCNLTCFHSLILFPILTICMSLLRITDDSGVFTVPTSDI